MDDDCQPAFPLLIETRERGVEATQYMGEAAGRQLWAYTLLSEARRACLLSVTADFSGHEVFYIVAPRTVMETPTLDLARQHFPQTEIRGALAATSGFFNCAKAERLLGWKHQD